MSSSTTGASPRKGCVYVLTFANGKQYVGLTSKTPGRRISQHRYGATKRVTQVHHAFLEHGEPELRVLLWSMDRTQLADVEEFYVHKLNTRYPHGYNGTNGGGCTNGDP